MRAMASGWLSSVLLLMSLLSTGCGSSASDFKRFMDVPLPSNVRVVRMDGNWGNDPWRCWELSPADETLEQELVKRWNLAPDLKAFNGVATGGKIYCRFDDLDESYAGSSDSYRAVGVKGNRMFVYFYNG